MPAWFKLYHELLRDKKVRMMATELDMAGALVRGLFVDLMCFAQELDHDWHLCVEAGLPLSDDLIIEELGADQETCERFLESARKYRLIEDVDGCVVITAGAARNAKPSDSPEAWRERKEKSRLMSRGSHAGRHAGQGRDCHATEKKREEEKETRGRADKSAVPPAVSQKYCPNDGAELKPDGDGTQNLHCTVCEYKAVAG
jgi:hypothetical protein